MSKKNQMTQANDSSNSMAELVEMLDGELQQIVGGGTAVDMSFSIKRKPRARYESLTVSPV